MITISETTDRAGALRHLERAASRSTDHSTADDLAHGCLMLDIAKNGRTVGAVAVEIAGRCATIKAAASEGDFVNQEWPLIEYELRRLGIEHVAFFTKRPGLIRAMQGAGFSVRECEMEKVL